MAAKIRLLIEKYWDIISYLFFGGLTTIVNYCVFYPLYWAKLPASICNMIAWVVAVAFAYVTNKPFVFKSRDWSRKTVVPELTKFVGCRVGSGLLETAIIFLFVDLLNGNGDIWKLVTSVLVVLLNYVASKLIVFKK